MASNLARELAMALAIPNRVCGIAAARLTPGLESILAA
jgi:hypothetical protein